MCEMQSHQLPIGLDMSAQGEMKITGEFVTSGMAVTVVITGIAHIL